MPVYCYRREDGEVVERIYPITNTPNEIVCEDGVKAVKVFNSFNIAWGRGGMPSASLKAQNERRTRDNIKAGERGAGEWREKMPKLMK